jgi:hypothetical protein
VFLKICISTFFFQSCKIFAYIEVFLCILYLLNYQAFTTAYRACNVESKLLLGYLSCVEEMLFPNKGGRYYALLYQIEWVREFPHVLLHLGDKYLSVKEDISEEEAAKEECAKKEQYLILGQYIKVPDFLYVN